MCSCAHTGALRAGVPPLPAAPRTPALRQAGNVSSQPDTTRLSARFHSRMQGCRVTTSMGRSRAEASALMKHALDWRKVNQGCAQQGRALRGAEACGQVRAEDYLLRPVALLSPPRPRPGTRGARTFSSNATWEMVHEPAWRRYVWPQVVPPRERERERERVMEVKKEV